MELGNHLGGGRGRGGKYTHRNRRHTNVQGATGGAKKEGGKTAGHPFLAFAQSHTIDLYQCTGRRKRRETGHR